MEDSTKVIAKPETTQASLFNLRDELIKKHSQGKKVELVEFILKINSCLYREYPIK